MLNLYLEHDEYKEYQIPKLHLHSYETEFLP